MAQLVNPADEDALTSVLTFVSNFEKEHNEGNAAFRDGRGERGGDCWPIHNSAA